FFRGSECLYCIRLPSGRRVHSSQPSTATFAAGARVRAEARLLHVVAFAADAAGASEADER
ncbi:MAG TPA: TOBE domain-containing protein, partial [Methylomirabilota bacterium]|nr:TOBE domain-containing protein [Methylomirabilota bacterium]